jgi:2'-5' RNA ligase
MTSASDTSEIAVWLMPAGDCAAWLRQTIETLSKRCGTVAFAPHMTLFAGRVPNVEAAVRKLAEIFARAQSPVLRYTGIEHSDAYFRSVFAAFEAAAAFKKLYRAAADGAGLRSAYDSRPHVSLMYSRLSRDVRAEIAKEIQPPFSEVRFDRAQLVVPGTPEQSWDDVGKWSVREEFRFAAAAERASL